MDRLPKDNPAQADLEQIYKGGERAKDLVITDLTMPGMSGDKLASELTKIRPNLPVILCSGFSRDMTKAAAESAGIKAFVPKPIRKDNLAAVIRQVLAGSEA
ncbi:MAG: response regulator [Desulfotignum sp.]|nr:response regulator [Desulfotignum sp.]